jgi:D-glycero-beta-D-manno-heptose 1-phosphate adenylyltransferase
MSKVESIESKIMLEPALTHALSLWRKEGKRIVFTNGCFDLLHLGHAEYLARAADLGDKLIVGLNSDASVSKLKGPTRPITDQRSRAFLMACFSFVDAVVLFEEETPFNLINIVLPDVLVKGGDYEPERVVGYETVTSRGGQVVCLPIVEGYSTTLIENRIKGSS